MTQNSPQKHDVELLSIGEAMAELRRDDSGGFDVSFAGDCFNTAIYAARLFGQPKAVGFASLVGHDPLSSGLIELASAEGLYTDCLMYHDDKNIGIYAVATDRIIDASFGYFIMPILSVFLGYIFFKERLNKKRIFSISLVILSIIILLFLSIKSLPWVGIVVGLSWGFYNLIRKKINVDTDIGLLIESLFILPFALITFYFVYQKGLNDFSTNNIPLSLFIMLAGPMTVIPLFLYVRGVELSGLGPAGMIFYITPTLQFLLGYFYYGEPFSTIKFVSFILIWIAVIIYLKDLYETN